MVPEELEKLIRKSIEEGKVPMMVNATSGTTVSGAFDDLVNFERTNFSSIILIKQFNDEFSRVLKITSF